jgi:hypothetical protein
MTTNLSGELLSHAPHQENVELAQIPPKVHPIITDSVANSSQSSQRHRSAVTEE